MFRRRNASVALSLFIVFAMTFGGIVHAAVPHSHGDEHGAGEAPIWDDLHHSIGHENKEVFALAAEFVALFTVAVVTFALVLVRTSEDLYALDPMRGLPLRRGIVPHRMFR